MLKENKSIAIKDINTYKTFSIFLYQGIREASSLLRPVWKVSDIRPQSYISVRVKCWNLRHTKTFTCYGLIKVLKFNSFFKFRVVKRQLRQWNPESKFFLTERCIHRNGATTANNRLSGSLFPTGFSLQIFLFHPFFNVSNVFVDVNALKKKRKKNRYYYIYKINIYYTKILFLDIHSGY